MARDIRDYARHFCAMALGSEPDADLRLAFQDPRELKVDVAYPFLLELYHDYKANALSKADLLASVRLVEAYVFRRAICGIPTNSMNKTFATFTKVLKKDRYFESIQAHFLEMRSYRRFPTDEEFHRDLQTRDLYNFRSRSYWLRRVENYDRRERVVVDEFTIEHVLPQNENLSHQWREALGPEWQRVQQTWLHPPRTCVGQRRHVHRVLLGGSISVTAPLKDRLSPYGCVAPVKRGAVRIEPIMGSAAICAVCRSQARAKASLGDDSLDNSNNSMGLP